MLAIGLGLNLAFGLCIRVGGWFELGVCCLVIWGLTFIYLVGCAVQVCLLCLLLRGLLMFWSVYDVWVWGGF